MDLQQLGLFLTHVLVCMQEYGQDLPSKGGRVRLITLDLEGAVARWMVTLHNTDAPEFWNFNRFMTALGCHFEHSLADRKARDRIKMVRQECRSVAKYTEEFRDLACRLN